MQKRTLHLGDIVVVKKSFMEEPEGVLAYVYEEYDIGDGPGVSIITQNGVNIGGFSPEEIDDYLQYVTHSRVGYHFQNVIKLDDDFPNIIKPIFDKVQYLAIDPDILTDKKYY